MAVLLPRRQFLKWTVGASALGAAPLSGWTQSYPSRPIRLFNGFPAGGTSDIVARLIGQGLSERLGQPFVIENRVGAATNIATEQVVRAAPDGHTLLVVTTANAVNASLYKNLSFNFIRDIAPIASASITSGVAVVHPSFPAKTIPEFIAYAKANPGKVAVASGGVGSFPHVAAELFKMLTGVSLVHVPYRGEAPALTDLIGGQVQVIFSTVAAAMEYIKAGQLRALAVTTSSRAAALPELPTIAEHVAGYEASSWQGFGAPKDTPREIVSLLNKEINALLTDSKVKDRLVGFGSAALVLSPADFAKFIEDDTAKWTSVVDFAGIKPP